MSESTSSPSVLRRRPVVGAAAGVLTALAVGASVLLLPGDGSTADAQPAADLRAQPMAARAALAHPVQPAQQVAAAVAAPARAARDPFRPLLTADAPGTSAPAGSPSVGTPSVGTPSVGTPDRGGYVGTLPDVVVVEPPRSGPAIPEPSVPDGSSGSVSDAKLELTGVEVKGDTFVAVLAIDGQKVRAEVSDSFGPGGQLLLLSLQQGPRASQWTAVVQAGRGEPFDVVSGTPTRIP